MCWELTPRIFSIDPFLLPGPIAVAGGLGSAVSDYHLFPNLLATLLRTLLSFGIASIFGVLLGLVAGSSQKIREGLGLVVDLFRSTPATALFPIFLVLFGIGDVSKVLTAAFSGFFVVVFNTIYGIKYASRARQAAARLMGMSWLQTITRVTFWESLPQTFIGLRGAMSLCLVIIVVMEMFIGTTLGLGARIIAAQITYEIPTMYALIATVGILGYALNLMLLFLEKKIVFWK